MANKSLFAIRHWDLPKLMLVTSGFFAVAALGFFLAVWLQLQAPKSQADSGVPKPLTTEEKNRIVNSLNAELNTNTTLPADPNAPPASHSQADEKDANAAAKLKILESLNAH